MTMRPATLATLALAPMFCLAFAVPAYAGDIGKSKKLGVGVGGGTHVSGVTAKKYLSETTAVQAFAGNLQGAGLSVGADYIMEMPDLAAWAPGRLFWGVGAGAGLVLYSINNNSGISVGISGVLQLGWHFNEFPLELITDWRPTFYVGDFLAGGHFNGGGGAIRWFF